MSRVSTPRMGDAVELKMCDVAAGDLRPSMCSSFLTLQHAPRELMLTFLLKYLECLAYFNISFVYVQFLSNEAGLGDQEAGYLYATYGALCTLIGLLLGHTIDKLGAQRSLVMGFACSIFARSTCFLFAESKTAQWVSGALLMPFGSALGVPVLALCIRRYTHALNRGMAFSVFYGVMCCATMSSSLLINRVRATVPDGMDVLGVHCSWQRLVVGVGCLATIICLPIAHTLREVQVSSDTPLEDQVLESYVPLPGTMIDAFKEISSTPKFWRLVALILSMCGVRMTFRHLDATFPKYLVRVHGESAPFELFLALNQAVSTVAAPIAAAILIYSRLPFDQTMILGAGLSGASLYFLAMDDSYLACVMMILTFTAGEVIWSPKLYEFSTMVAPLGREGVYLSLTMAPIYLASVPVGALSGFLLGELCAEDAVPEERRTHLMWFIIGTTCFSSALILVVFRSQLLSGFNDPEPEPEAVSMDVEAHAPGEEAVEDTSCLSPTRIGAPED